MSSTIRKLVFHKNSDFTGWSCTECGWVRPIPHQVEPKGIETDFANHDCSQNPRDRENTAKV
jgi:hypothetical protein